MIGYTQLIYLFASYTFLQVNRIMQKINGYQLPRYKDYTLLVSKQRDFWLFLWSHLNGGRAGGRGFQNNTNILNHPSNHANKSRHRLLVYVFIRISYKINYTNVSILRLGSFSMLFFHPYKAFNANVKI